MEDLLLILRGFFKGQDALVARSALPAVSVPWLRL